MSIRTQKEKRTWRNRRIRRISQYEQQKKMSNFKYSDELMSIKTRKEDRERNGGV